MLNSSSNLYKREWLNLVFKNRNQSYGAYELRLHSDQNTLRALFIAAPLFILLFASPKIYEAIKGETVVDNTMNNTRELILDLPPRVEQPKPQEKPAPKPEPLPAPKNIKTAAVPANPVVVSTPVEIEPPTLEQLENAAIGPVSKDGEATGLASVPAEGNGAGVGTGNAASGSGKEDNSIHEASLIEAYPEFEGGMKGWAKYLQRNLRYPSDAAEIGTQGKVFISFVVEKDGSISNVTLIKGIFASMDKEAMRVISKSPKWKPGIQNQQNVRVRYTMPISFALTQ